jgi:hypothetical protein
MMRCIIFTSAMNIKHMKKKRIKLTLRKIVLATAFPPFLQIYRAYYALVIHIVVRIFKKYPSIQAAYLRRGAGKGEIFPLLSDVDLAVFVEGMARKERESLNSVYNRLVKMTKVLDPNLEIYDETYFYTPYKFPKQYRFLEAKATWKRLYGKDFIAYMDPVSVKETDTSLFSEIKLWWAIFGWRLFQDRKYHEETVTQNNVCYKAVSEILKMNLALKGGTLIFSRAKALKMSKPFLDANQELFVERLERIRRNRFLTGDHEIVDDTKNFLLNYLDRALGPLCRHSLERHSRKPETRVEYSEMNIFWFSNEQNHVNRLVSFLKENWLHAYQGAYITPCAHFYLDERLLIVLVDVEHLPTEKQLRELYQFHSKTAIEVRSRIHLYILLTHISFQIDAYYGYRDYIYQPLNAILTPFSSPDVFELMHHHPFRIDGKPRMSIHSGVWMQLVENTHQTQKKFFLKILDGNSKSQWNTFQFLRVFWKTAQLIIICSSLKQNRLFYPLTVPSIVRTLTEEGLSLPHRLEVLAEIYPDVVKGKNINISDLLQESITFLKEIDPNITENKQ